jgi:5-(carboxyamino)imidazole ribonucleotide synthase
MAPRLGILGGGQLALMLSDAATWLGFEPQVYRGGWSEKDLPALTGFLSAVDIVGFESEFVPTDVLRKAAAGLKCRFLPDLDAMERMRDKLQQKAALATLNIPTSPWVQLPAGAHWGGLREGLWKKFPQGMALKWAQLGYDGLGTCLLKRGADESVVEPFLVRAREKGVEVFAEELVPFEYEVAVVCARTESGLSQCYPLVISENRGGVCHKVFGPATKLGVAAAIEAQAQDSARRLGAAVGWVGSYALEFFLTKDRHLLVNEIAPRVHNTGHYSQDACMVSQFENHWLTLLGQRPVSPEPAASFAMLNLLGPVGPRRELKEPPALKLPAEAQLQWYGKTEVRPGRKMGHVNLVGGTEKEQRRILEEIDRQWCLAVHGPQ